MCLIRGTFRRIFVVTIAVHSFVSHLSKVQQDSNWYLEGIWARWASDTSSGGTFDFMVRLTCILERFPQIFFISDSSKADTCQMYLCLGNGWRFLCFASKWHFIKYCTIPTNSSVTRHTEKNLTLGIIFSRLLGILGNCSKNKGSHVWRVGRNSTVFPHSGFRPQADRTLNQHVGARRRCSRFRSHAVWVIHLTRHPLDVSGFTCMFPLAPFPFVRKNWQRGEGRRHKPQSVSFMWMTPGS